MAVYGCRHMSARHELIEAASGEGTFLGRLPDSLRERLLADASVIETRRGQTVFSAEEAADRVGIVAGGLVRTFLTADDGRRLTVRYARVGAMVGSITEGRAALSVQAISDSALLELRVSTLQECLVNDGRVGMVLLAEVAQRLRDTYATLASNTFGSMRERVARHILDLSFEEPGGLGPSATVTQQGLADGVGTVREVVARILRDFRAEGLVSTSPGRIRILDADGLAALIGHELA